jgi:hypothetical protein
MNDNNETRFFIPLEIKLWAPPSKGRVFYHGTIEELPEEDYDGKIVVEGNIRENCSATKTTQRRTRRQRTLGLYIISELTPATLSHISAQPFAMTTRIIINMIMTVIGTMNHDHDQDKDGEPWTMTTTMNHV